MQIAAPSHVSATTYAAERLADRVDEVSTIPQVLLRIIRAAEDESAGPEELRHALESDAALSARVLRYVNSSAVGLRSRVTNLRTAIIFVGYKQIRNLAVTASVSDIFRAEEPIGAYSRRGLWRHLVAVGVTARFLAKSKGMANHEDAFLAGLLHDLGIILEDQYAHVGFHAVIDSLSPNRTLAETERSRLGFDHTQLGLAVARRWGFPTCVQDAIRHHHSSVAFRGSDVDLVRTVEAANILCSAKDISSVGLNLVRSSNAIFDMLQLRSRREELSARVDAELDRARDLFAL